MINVNINKAGTDDASLADTAAAFVVNALDDRQSLSEFSAGSRISPPVLIDAEVARMDPQTTTAINQVLLSIYCGHYLNVVSRMAKVGKVTVAELLDPLSTSSPHPADIGRSAMGMESMDALPWETDSLDLMADYSMESNDRNQSPLAVGKELKVPLSHNGKEIIVPVTVTLLPRVLAVDFMTSLLEAFLARDNSYIGRYHRWRAGEIKSFIDYAFGLDMAEEDMRLRIEDKDGMYEYAKRRQQAGTVTSFLSGKKRKNIAAAMIVMSSNTAARMETSMRGTFANPRQRHRFFETTGSMILCVVETAKERVRIYQRGIPEYGVYTYDELRPAATNPNAMDINAIIRAYKLGDAFSM